jgi:hypothetical protein
MMQFLFDFNSLMFDRDRGMDRIAAGLVAAAVLAALARSTEGFFTSLFTAALFRSAAKKTGR